jgi:hypothetical protein
MAGQPVQVGSGEAVQHQGVMSGDDKAGVTGQGPDVGECLEGTRDTVEDREGPAAFEVFVEMRGVARLSGSTPAARTASRGEAT